MSASPQPARLSLRAPADVIAAIPYLLGYPPEHSLVALAMVGPGGGGREQVGFLSRIDLPAAAECLAAADLLADTFRTHRVTSVVLAAFGPVPTGLWPTILTRLRAEGVIVRDAIGVHRGRWWSAVCTNPDCCPPEGRPVLSATEPGGPSRVAAECVGAGLAVGRKRTARG